PVRIGEGIFPLFSHSDQGTAHYSSVRMFQEAIHMFPAGDTEPDGYRHRTRLSNGVEKGIHLLVKVAPYPGRSQGGDTVDKAFRIGDDSLDPFTGGGGHQ